MSALSKLEEERPDFFLGSDPLLGRSWLMHAASIGSLETIEWLVRKGCSLNSRDADGSTVLNTVLSRKDQAKHLILERLIKLGANCDLSGFEGWAPVHLAAASGDLQSLGLLVHAGADLAAATTYGLTARSIAEANGKSEVIQYIDERY